MLSVKISIQFLFVLLCSTKGDSSKYKYNHPPQSDIEAIPVAVVYDEQLASSGRSAATTESLLTTYHPRFRKIKALEDATEEINRVQIKTEKSGTVSQTLDPTNNLQIPVAVVYDTIDEIKKSTKDNLDKLINHMHSKQHTFRGNIKASSTKETTTVLTSKKESTLIKNDKTADKPTNEESLKPSTETIITIPRSTIQKSRKPTTAPPKIVSKISDDMADSDKSSKSNRTNDVPQVTESATKLAETSQTIKNNEKENDKSQNINTNTPAIPLDKQNVQKDLNIVDTKKPAPQAHIHKNDDKPKITRTKDPVVPIIDSQNYVFAYSGDFHYSYESGDGTKAFEEGSMKPNETVIGGFSYKDKDGKDISLTYKAGVDGYQPVGAHLPTPPPIPPAIARALKYLATKTTPADEAVTESLKQ